MKKKGFFAALIVLGALVLPSSAFGQATRTWVSGVGDDANPCSRTAPCKTFAGAISKTAAAGEINCMDPGAFGALTITKSIQVDCRGVHAGVLASGGINGININAGVNDKVVLRGLDINGTGTTLGLNGINVIQAKTVKVEQTTIRNFSRNGVIFTPGIQTRGVISHAEIFNMTGNGVLLAPSVGGNASRVVIRRSEIDEVGCGATASSTGTPTHNYASNCGVPTSGSGGSAIMVDLNSSFTNATAAGIFANGGSAAHRIGGNEIIFNTFGLVAGAGGAILSFGDNYIAGNGTDGAPTGTIPRS